jgi:hypothetical protein
MVWPGAPSVAEHESAGYLADSDMGTPHLVAYRQPNFHCNQPRRGTPTYVSRTRAVRRIRECAAERKPARCRVLSGLVDKLRRYAATGSWLGAS